MSLPLGLSPPHRRAKGWGRWTAALALSAALVTGACSGGDATSTKSTTSTAAAATPDQPNKSDATPQSSPRQAAEAFLAAEKAGDHAASYRLLTRASRKELTAGAWTRRRSEVPPITGFSIDDEGTGTVVAIVEHEPALDPFIGLSPARERQTWKAHKEGAGWLLEPEPVVQAMYPPAAGARPAALEWAQAVQACDQAAARKLQAVEVLFGTTGAPSTLCKAAAVTVGEPGALAAGPSSQELVSQYGVDVLDWARTVPVTGGQRPFHAVLAPIGSVWRVVGVFEP